MVEVIGYILVAVNLSPAGDVGGTAINYYANNMDCYTDAVLLEEEANPGVGFVCLEDFLILNEQGDS
tara:strand:- start:271 stop:471 length:201 start_codon:yes stop_codon:yes gene_type:complete